MKHLQNTRDPRLRAERVLLTNAITLIALGLSILFLNSWPDSFVKVSVGLFWGAFFLILNRRQLFAPFRIFIKTNDNHRASFELSRQR